MATAQPLKIELDRDVKKAFSDLTRAIEKNNDLRQKELNEARSARLEGQRQLEFHQYISGGEDGLECTKEHTFHDDQTLAKVYNALMDAYPGPDDPQIIATNMVSAMQNAGILFREREEVGGVEDSTAPPV